MVNACEPRLRDSHAARPHHDVLSLWQLTRTSHAKVAGSSPVPGLPAGVAQW